MIKTITYHFLIFFTSLLLSQFIKNGVSIVSFNQLKSNNYIESLIFKDNIDLHESEFLNKRRCEVKSKKYLNKKHEISAPLFFFLLVDNNKIKGYNNSINISLASNINIHLHNLF